MDEESKQLLREIRDLQREQMELLRRYLLPPWMRMRFSVRSLLIFMTLVAVLLGVLVLTRSMRSTPLATPPAPMPVSRPVIR
jgi:hypothetical protein